MQIANRGRAALGDNLALGSQQRHDQALGAARDCNGLSVAHDLEWTEHADLQHMVNRRFHGLGYTDVAHLDCGFNAWKAASRPVEKM
jgi:hypothetical protein